MAQQQILEHEVLAWAHPGQDGREQQPEQFKHALSIADLRAREDLLPHNLSAVDRSALRSVFRDLVLLARVPTQPRSRDPASAHLDPVKTTGLVAIGHAAAERGSTHRRLALRIGRFVKGGVDPERTPQVPAIAGVHLRQCCRSDRTLEGAGRLGSAMVDRLTCPVPKTFWYAATISFTAPLELRHSAITRPARPRLDQRHDWLGGDRRR